jgi:hypothetical protein
VTESVLVSDAPAALPPVAIFISEVVRVSDVVTVK